MIYFLYLNDGKQTLRLGQQWFGDDVVWHSCSISEFLLADVTSNNQVFVYLDEMPDTIIEDNTDFFKQVGFVVFTGDFSKYSTSFLHKISEYGVFIDERSMTRELLDLYLEEVKIISENYKKLRDAEKNMQDFISFIAHEIRTPLTSIMGAADLYTTETDLEAKDRYVSSIIDSSNFLLKLLNQNLDYAKVKEGKLELANEFFSLNGVVKEVETLLVPRVNQKRIDLKIDISSNTPNYLVGDPERLEQVLLNLAGNSIKFTPNNGKVSIKVKYLGKKDNNYQLEFSIKDTGPGISKDKIGLIFNKFEQEDELVKKKYGGSGLGLNISQLFVDKMGGKIKVQSEVGKGSVFSFTVGLKTPSPKNKKVALLSNRESPILISLCNEIVESGHELNIFSDSCNIIKGLEENVFDCILVNEDNSDTKDSDEIEKKIDNKMFLVLNSSGDNVRNLRVKSDYYRSLNSKSFDSILNQINFYQPIKNTVLNDIADNYETNLKILLVDDGPDIQMIIRAYFKKVGIYIDTADNGLEAYEKIMRNNYDVVLMDLQMPVMNGLEATQKIRKWEKENKKPSLPIIALTAASFKEDIDNVYSVGCNFHLAKPIEKDKLISTVFEHARYKKAS